MGPYTIKLSARTDGGGKVNAVDYRAYRKYEVPQFMPLSHL
jgi:hypothetical protein